ncbi:MAG TPA: hypothetical protein DCQ30_00590 [Acidimicrobiaceae bacterium]|nr:hypothetical protein [Acidimicrobiaceae bacterium]
MTADTTSEKNERDDILEALAAHRGFLRRTVRDLTDEQAAMRPTVSELCLGGIIKHVTAVERAWADFVRRGPVAMAFTPERAASHAAGFRMEPGDTLAGLLDDYEAAARETDELVVSAASLDESQPLPEAPWFPPGARRSVRRVMVHLVAETAQHAGHADIIRESIDGAKTMG